LKDMNQQLYEIYYQSRELARELGDPLLGTVTAASPEEAVRKAERDPAITGHAMPCCGLWAVRVREAERGSGEQPPRRRA
jgi:hypothetical protein